MGKKALWFTGLLAVITIYGLYSKNGLYEYYYPTDRTGNRTGIFEMTRKERQEFTALQICSQDEDIIVRKLSQVRPESMEELWKVCTEILGEENETSWQHHTYRIYTSRKGRRDFLLIYQTRQTEGGFFYVGEDGLYQVMRLKEEDFEVELAKVRHWIEETSMGDSMDEDSLWECALWEAVRGKGLDDGIDWREEEIRKQVYKKILQEDAVLSREQITSLSELDIFISDEDSIESFQDLSNLIGLNRLYVGGCGLTDISFVENMTELTWINVAGNSITDISSLKNLEHLQYVSIARNQISDLSPLTGKTEITVLYAENNKIQDISVLKDMDKLINLDLDNNQIRDYTPLQDMKSLMKLSVENNPGQDIGNLIMEVPYLFTGIHELEELVKVQEFLISLGVEADVEAENYAIGDLNMDGVDDMVILAHRVRITTDDKYGDEITVDMGDWTVYVFLGTDQDGFLYQSKMLLDLPETPETVKSSTGMVIAGGRLAIQIPLRYVRDNNIYIFEQERLRPVYEMTIRQLVKNDFDDKLIGLYKWWIKDVAADRTKSYYMVEIDGRYMERLLIEDSGFSKEMESSKALWPKGIEPSDYLGIFGGNFWFNIHDIRMQYDNRKQPGEILESAAEQFLDDSSKTHIPEYASKEIKRNFDCLAGVELPDSFYLGYVQGEMCLLSYRKCVRYESGEYVHLLEMRRMPSEYEDSSWQTVYYYYYYEDTDTFIVKKCI